MAQDISPKKRALIAMSGGVDSCTAAYLMQQAGYDCTGCTMRLHDAAKNDADDAKAVCERLHMPHFVPDCRAEFHNKVIEKFVQSYAEGRTPNPCLDCNRCLKFGRLMQEADALGCDTLVTGHYARIEQAPDGSFLLKKAADPAKDQSYVLYMLTQRQLARICFPLGGLTKAQVRQTAAEQGFVSAHKSESQDICFVPDGNYAAVIEAETRLPAVPGDFTDSAGNVIGQHAGIIHYTIGQRRGLGIALGAPAYVCGIDAENNRVIIGQQADLFTDCVYLQNMNWIAGAPPAGPVRCAAKIRYRHREQPALLTFTEENTAVLRFDAPQRAVTPGQAAVCYDGDTVLGGGEIIRAELSGKGVKSDE